MRANKPTATAKAGTDSDGLTAQVRQFCLEYLKDRNGTKAAERAGYSRASAASQASRLLRNPKVRAYLDREIARVEEGQRVTIDRIERELERIAFLDPAGAFDEQGKLLPVAEMPEDVRRALPGFDVERDYDWVDDELEPGRKKKRIQVGETVKVRWPNKTEALKLFLQRRGALVQKHEVEHGGAVSVSISINGIKRKAAGK